MDVGAGLGHNFLRHIERTRVLIHLLDGNSNDPLEDWAMINQELALYDARLEDKPQIVVLNKIDLPEAKTWEPLIEEMVQEAGYPFLVISALTRSGLRGMLYRVKQMLDDLPEPELEPEEIKIISPAPAEEEFAITRLDDGWRIEGDQIERIAAMTYWEFEATARRFQQILDRMGISSALVEAGVSVGDTVYVGDEILEWGE
jgi:GTP-binding protein